MKNNLSHTRQLLLVLFVFPIAPSFVAMAQSDQTTDCEAAAPAEAPTKTVEGPDSGTKNMGSTGWTGGTGGSHNDTTAAGPTPGSETKQPETVQGLDPSKPVAKGHKPC